ncbi:MAG: hypothetical protein LT067_01520 [Sulfurovum sp.]|nr:hypothetical protein [Sulfurovum sp.]
MNKKRLPKSKDEAFSKESASTRVRGIEKGLCSFSRKENIHQELFDV